MMIPTIHLNGTARRDLLDELETAHVAVANAMDAMRQITVHGRDYYPQGPDAYRQARWEMDARLDQIKAVQSELYEMYRTIEDLE